MHGLSMGLGLDRKQHAGRELIFSYDSDFSSDTDGFSVFSVKTFELTANTSIGGEDAALEIAPFGNQDQSFGYVERFMGNDFSEYDNEGYSYEFSVRYYREGNNPFLLALRMGARGQSQNNNALFATNPAGVTGTWTEVSASASFGTMTGDYLSLFVQSLPETAGTSLYVKDIKFRVYA